MGLPDQGSDGVMPMDHHSIVLSNRRRMGYAVYGREDGVPAFYFHGLPGSRREGVLLDQACRDSGVRLIAPDRPGYGLSEPVDGPRMEQWPLLVGELADRLGLERFYLFAASGGAPYALACAGVLRDRVMGTGICCGLGELARNGMMEGMSFIARLGFGMARRNPAWLRHSYGAAVTLAARTMPCASIRVLAWQVGQPDRAVLNRPWVREQFAANLHEAFRQGSAGGVADMVTALRPWPFDPEDIRSLRLWHGRRDRVVPLRHSEALAARVPGACLSRVEGEGHFSLPVRYASVMVDAVIHAKEATP